MSRIVRSYLSYTRGESPASPWNLLYPTQFVTRAWMRLRIFLFERGIFTTVEPKLPVVSIGNNSFGGTNKTPMCEYIVRMFHEAGINAGLVSRGYKTKHPEPIWIGQDEDSFRRDIAGDEPLMLAKRLPGVSIVVAKNRVKGVELLSDLGAEIAVTDDTFQHRRMARDVDVVLVDGTCPFGNGRVIPAGLMREPKTAFGRADMVVITKANQITEESVRNTRTELEKYVSPEKIFVAEINYDSWLVYENGSEPVTKPINEKPKGSYVVFSAIGNPEGFYRYVAGRGITVAAERTYQDHHEFTAEDVDKLNDLAERLGASGFICTEKDTMNLPKDAKLKLPVYVLRISVVMPEKERFREMLCEKLRPHLMVASNGYGEDAIGVILAKKMRERFKSAAISAFAFVGSGKHYEKEGIEVVSPSVEMPSGGIVKYNVGELVNDFRHGLGTSIKRQIATMRKIGRDYRTPVCVGDVYLFSNVLWGQGVSPVLLATAKSVHLSGHYRVERFLLRKRSRRVWTRDAETAQELTADGVSAEFCGNPVMDLINDSDKGVEWKDDKSARVVLLPGSRPRAYNDISLVIEAARELSKRVQCQFVMVPAPTTNWAKMAGSLEGWTLSADGTELSCRETSIHIHTHGQVTAAATGADLLIGLGGTANQLCAGLGLPVVSIMETGKLRQKKLLQEAEVLVDANPAALADAAQKILEDPELWKSMSEAGIRHLGGQGALDSVVQYCASELGWDNRCSVYEKFRNYIDASSETGRGE